MSKNTEFPKEVADKLKHYVYRLIDPRNGETFYVGKGVGNRVFNHAKGFVDTQSTDEQTLSTKLNRVRMINLVGLEVQHIIHRHGMDEETAFAVEGALIDAYPGLTNIAGGHKNGKLGTAHADEIIREYTAETIDFSEISEKVVAITINMSAENKDVYSATRFAWKMDITRARQIEVVLAVVEGMVVEVFVPDCWNYATTQFFPDLVSDVEKTKRIAFSGEKASEKLRRIFYDKKMPPKRKGAANPIQYFD